MPVNQIEFRTFVLDGLRAIGAPARRIEAEVYQATLPIEVQKTFGNRREVTFTFERRALDDYPDAELVTLGGNLLNRLIEVLRKRAQAASITLSSQEPLPPAQFACPLPTLNSTAVGMAVIASYAPLTQFLLKVTYVTDEKFEQIFEVTVDHASGKIELDKGEFDRLLNRPSRAGRPAELLVGKLDETQALLRALDVIKPLVEQRVRAIEATASRRLDEELARIRAFYAAPAPSPAAVQVAAPGTSPTLTEAEALQIKEEMEHLQQLQQEKEHKLEMARERYRLMVRTNLLSATTIFRPLHRYTFQITLNRTGAKAPPLPLVVERDPFSQAVSLPTCENCKGAMAQVCYCEQGLHLICQSCAQVCTSCQRAYCTAHPLGTCPVDGAGVCNDCLFEADECGHRACPQHQTRCHVSNRTVCAQCAQVCSTCGHATCPTHLLGCHIDHTPVCVNCVVKCARCNEITCTKDQVLCRTCGEIACRACAAPCADPACRRFHCKVHLQQCATASCTGLFCPDHVAACAECGKPHCQAHTTTCPECRLPVGAGCAIACVSHGHMVCRKHAQLCSVCKKTACPKGLVACSSCGRATCLKDAQRCEQDGLFYCPTCSDRCVTCQAVTCARHLATCEDCGRRHCTKHILPCHIDQHPFCQTHSAICATCGRFHCRKHTVSCHICGQAICSACRSGKGICRLCATFKNVPANDPRILQAHTAISSRGVRPRSVASWLISETPLRRIIVAQLAWSTHLFVFNAKDGAPLAHKHFGFFDRGVIKAL
jgi:hypothetical protein